MRPGLCVALLIFLAAAPAGAQDLAPAREEARAVIQRLTDTMMRHLEETLAEQGPAGATQVCRQLAPEIGAAIAAETGWEIRRTAFRVRNPDNRPNEQELAVLRGYQARVAAGQSMAAMETIQLVVRDGRTHVHYMRAVPTYDTCLACHGANLAPEVAAAIAQSYPEDEAVGFAEGDLRGAMSLYKPYDPAAPGDAASRAARDWQAIAALDLPSPVALGVRDLEGDPARGRDLYKANCYACHDPRRLARKVFDPDREAPKIDVCRILETHGLTDQAGDCDIIAFLKVLARQ